MTNGAWQEVHYFTHEFYTLTLLSLASEAADQSIISVADSASNFDEHVGDDFDEVDAVDPDDVDNSVSPSFYLISSCVRNVGTLLKVSSFRTGFSTDGYSDAPEHLIPSYQRTLFKC